MFGQPPRSRRRVLIYAGLRKTRISRKDIQAIHLILDNYATHTHLAVEAWFAAHPRYHRHFTPTGGSWLNLVERFFAEITDKRIRHGAFRSVGELILDNIGAHKVADVRPLVEGRGARLIYLPPYYSPDFNPIEQAWSKIKQQLRSAKGSRPWRKRSL